MINDSTRETFETRSKIIKYIRRFLDDRDFLEVQTRKSYSLIASKNNFSYH